MNIKALFVLFLAMATVSVSAQKFGHINSTALLLEIQDVKTADKELQAYQQGLITAGEELVKSFQGNYEKYLKDANDGVLTAIQMQTREKSLQDENENIKRYEVQISQLLAVKKEELYKPILDKVRVAIETVGKDNGYTMIFDTSTGFLLHSVESEDVMSMVKAKLGL